MTKLARRVSMLLASLAAGTAMSIVGATAAHAYEDAAEATTKTFVMNNKPDVSITVRLGVWGPYDGYLRHQAIVTWDGTLTYTGGKRFHHFIIDVRAEQYVNSKDSIMGRISCDITAAINAQENGTAYCPVLGSKATRTSSKIFSTDGDVSYDIAGDGNGNFGWGLAGTPRISNY